MLYLRARYYSPVLGVFTALDPVETLNRYQYVGGNTINLVDPSGMILQPPAVWDSCTQNLSQVSECIETAPCQWTWVGTGNARNCPPNYNRLLNTDWVGLGLVMFDGQTSDWGDGNCEIALLALDLILRATRGKTPADVVRWIAGSSGNTYLFFYPLQGTSIGAGYAYGQMGLYAANIPNSWRQPSGIAAILHEMAHGIDESEHFTIGGGFNAVGYRPIIVRVPFSNSSEILGWEYNGSLEFGTGHGPANNYIAYYPSGDFNHPQYAPWEDFANSFASVVISLNQDLGLIGSTGRNDLSDVVALTGDANRDGVMGTDELGPVDETRRQIIMNLLGR